MKNHNSSHHLRSIIRWSQSNQGCLTIALSIGLYYLAIYRPLHHKTVGLDAPLRQSWARLEAAHEESLTQDRLDLDQISRGLRRLEDSFTERTNTNERLLARIAIEPEYQSRAEGAFQLIEFQNERQSNIEAMASLAKAHSCTIAPSVFDGFPQYQSQQENPQLLWTELALTKHLVQSMIYSEIKDIESLTTRRQRSPSPSSSNPQILLIPFATEAELSCNTQQLYKLLLMLPSRSEEIAAQLGIDYPQHKPSLFVDGILIRKNSREKPDTVSVWLKVVSFISVRTGSNENPAEG